MTVMMNEPHLSHCRCISVHLRWKMALALVERNPQPWKLADHTLVGRFLLEPNGDFCVRQVFEQWNIDRLEVCQDIESTLSMKS